MWFFFSPAQADSASFPPQAFRIENKLVFMFLIKHCRFESAEYGPCSLVPLSGSLAFKSDLFYLHVAMRALSASLHVFIAVMFMGLSFKELEKQLLV